MRLFGVLFGSHIHSGASIKPDTIANAAAEQFGHGNALGLSGQIVESYFHGAIEFMQIQLPAGPFATEYRYPAMIRNNSSKPVQLSDPAVSAPGATVQLQETEPGKTFRLNLSFPAQFQAQPGAPMELTVKTTHPRYPVMKIPIIQTAPPAPVAPPLVPATGAK